MDDSRESNAQHPEIPNETDVPERSASLHNLLEDARRRLVDTGTRNRLVHVNRKNARANAINVINERSDEIYNLLSTSKKSMRFLAIGSEDLDDDLSDTPSLSALESDADIEEDRYTDRNLETRLTSDALQKRLLRLAKDSDTAEEEQGINILFLAMGFLSWFEDKSSSMQREAPLILLPVQLKRSTRTSKYEIVVRDDDIVANLPLQERLMGDFGLALPDIEATEEWNPSAYFDAIDEVISARDGWSIDRDGMQLGFFSFGKLLMLRDLDPKNWPDRTLADNPLVKGLLYSGFESEPPLFGPEDRLDEKLQPSDIIQVVDADASQTKVIEEVRAGRDLVVEGPPGTGKSQTITNIIAAAVADGKSVLFMAEKMVALKVVHQKLQKVDLDSVCLELHSRAANKKAVHQEIRKTLDAGRAAPNSPDAPDDLKRIRDSLNKFSDLMHTPLGATGETPFSVIGEQAQSLGRGLMPPGNMDESLSGMNKETFEDSMALVKVYAKLVEEAGVIADHPCEGVRNLMIQPTDLVRLSQLIAQLSLQVGELHAIFSEFAPRLGLDSSPSIQSIHQLTEILEALNEAPEHFHEVAAGLSDEESRFNFVKALEKGLELQDLRAGYHANFIEQVVEVDLLHLRPGLVSGQTSFFGRLGSKYRNASGELAGYLSGPIPKSASERLALLDSVLEFRKSVQDFNPETKLLKSMLGPIWRDLDSPFKELLKLASWCRRLLSLNGDLDLLKALSVASAESQLDETAKTVSTKLAEFEVCMNSVFVTLDYDCLALFGVAERNGVELQKLVHRLDRLADLEDHYGAWCRLRNTAGDLDKAGLPKIRSGLDAAPGKTEDLIKGIRFARAEKIWKENLTADLQAVSQSDRQQIVRTYQKLEKQRVIDCRREILSSHLSQLPSGSVGEMGIIRSELGKKSRHKALRLQKRSLVRSPRLCPVSGSQITRAIKELGAWLAPKHHSHIAWQKTVDQSASATFLLREACIPSAP